MTDVDDDFKELYRYWLSESMSSYRTAGDDRIVGYTTNCARGPREVIP
jgi:hypothetical protein